MKCLNKKRDQLWRPTGNRGVSPTSSYPVLPVTSNQERENPGKNVGSQEGSQQPSQVNKKRFPRNPKRSEIKKMRMHGDTGRVKRGAPYEFEGENIKSYWGDENYDEKLERALAVPTPRITFEDDGDDRYHVMKIQDGVSHRCVTKHWGELSDYLDVKCYYVILPHKVDEEIRWSILTTFNLLYALGWVQPICGMGKEKRIKLFNYLCAQMSKNYLTKFHQRKNLTADQVVMGDRTRNFWHIRKEFWRKVMDSYHNIGNPFLKRFCLESKVVRTVQGQSFNAFMPIFQYFIDFFGIIATWTGSMMNAASEYFKAARKSVMGWVDWFSRTLKLAMTQKWRRRFVIFLIAYTAITGMMALGFTVKIIIQCCKFMAIWFHGKPVEIDEDEGAPINVVRGQTITTSLTTLAALLSTVTGEKVTLQTINTCFSLGNGSKNFFDDTIEWFQRGIDFISFRYTGDYWFRSRKLHQRFYALREDFTKYTELNPNFTEAALTNPTIIDVVKDFTQKAEMLQLDALGDTALSPAVSIVIKEFAQKMSDLRKKLLECDPRRGMRSTPVVLWFMGEPGQGKTTLAQLFSAHVWKRIRYKAPNDNIVPDREFLPTDDYSKPDDSEYWSKYGGQFVHSISDIFCKDDSLERSKEGAMFLKLIEDKSMPLNGASLDEKGNLFFTSKMVTVTTNFKDFDRLGMTDPNAVIRRVHFPMHVTKKKDIVLSENTTLKDLNEAWDIIVVNKCIQYRMQPCIPAQHYTFSQLVRHIASRIISEHRKSKTIFVGKNISGKDYSSSSSSTSTSSDSEDPPDQGGGVVPPDFLDKEEAPLWTESKVWTRALKDDVDKETFKRIYYSIDGQLRMRNSFTVLQIPIGDMTPDTFVKLKFRHSRDLSPYMEELQFPDPERGIYVNKTGTDWLYSCAKCQKGFPRNLFEDRELEKDVNRICRKCKCDKGKQPMVEGQVISEFVNGIREYYMAEVDSPTTYEEMEQMPWYTRAIVKAVHWLKPEEGATHKLNYAQFIRYCAEYNLGKRGIFNQYDRVWWFKNFGIQVYNWLAIEGADQNDILLPDIQILITAWEQCNIYTDGAESVLRKDREEGKTAYTFKEDEAVELGKKGQTYYANNINYTLASQLSKYYYKVWPFQDRLRLNRMIANWIVICRSFPFYKPMWNKNIKPFMKDGFYIDEEELDRQFCLLSKTMNVKPLEIRPGLHKDILVMSAAAAMLGTIAYAITTWGATKAEENSNRILMDTSSYKPARVKKHHTAKSIDKGHKHKLPKKPKVQKSIDKGHKHKLPKKPKMNPKSIDKGHKHKLPKKPKNQAVRIGGKHYFNEYLAAPMSVEGSFYNDTVVTEVWDWFDNGGWTEEFEVDYNEYGVFADFPGLHEIKNFQKDDELGWYFTYVDRETHAVDNDYVFMLLPGYDYVMLILKSPDELEPAPLGTFNKQTADFYSNYRQKFDHSIGNMNLEPKQKIKPDAGRNVKSIKKTVKGQASLTEKMQSLSMMEQAQWKVRMFNSNGKYMDVWGWTSGYLFITISHGIKAVGGVDHIDFYDSTQTNFTHFGVRVLEVRYALGRDLAILQLDNRTCSAFPSIERRLFSRDSQDYQRAMKSDAYRLNLDKGKVYAIPGKGVRHVVAQDIKVQYDTLFMRTDSIIVSEYYEIVGLKGLIGDCGRGVGSMMSGHAHDWLGLHFATIGQDGLVVPVFREDLMLIKGQCDVYMPPWLKVKGPLSEKAHIAGLRSIGHLERSDFVATSTAFEPSPIKGQMERDGYLPVAPATLTFTRYDGKIVDPHKKALTKFTTRLKPQKLELIDHMLEKPSRGYKGFGDVDEAKELSREQACFGDPDRNIDSIPVDTSITYEFKDKFHTREQLVDKENRIIHKDVHDELDRLIDAAEKGNEIVTVASGQWKDELRTLDRVFNGSTRLFYVATFSLFIFCKMFVGDLMAQLKQHLAFQSSSVGINPYGFHWMQLLTYLYSVDGGLIGGDCSGWDISVLFQMTYAFWDYLRVQYKAPHGSRLSRILWAVARSIVGTYFIYGPKMYRIFRGVISGHFLTSFFNSFCNFCIHRLIFNKKRPLRTLKFEANVRLRTYGDDNVGKVSKGVESWFNMLSIKEGFTEYFGMRYTTPGKDDVVKPFLDFDELEFLSRKFSIKKSEDGTWEYVLAPLNFMSILGMLGWIKTSKFATCEEQFLINVQTACRELSLHGEEVYNGWTNRLLAWASEVGVRMKIPIYEEVFKRLMDVYYVNDQPMY